ALLTGRQTFDFLILFFFSSRRRHTRFKCDWSSDVCSSDLLGSLETGSIETLAETPEVGTVQDDAAVFGEDTASQVVGDLELSAEIGRASCRERGWRWGGGAA